MRKRPTHQGVYLGYSLQYSVDDSVSTQATPSKLTCKKENDPIFIWDEPGKVSLYPYATQEAVEFKRDDSAMLDHWGENAGGILSSVYAKGSSKFDLEHYEKQTEDDPANVAHQAEYKIKLYTVLSAHKPNQISPIPPVPEGTTPDWDALERLVKYPKYKWVNKRAVEQYVHFLQLKNEHNDFRSETFLPSIPIDMIWHAHLSFLDRYHRDVQALTGSTGVLEHSPVLGEDAKKRYAAAHQAHVARYRSLQLHTFKNNCTYLIINNLVHRQHVRFFMH
jgi:hypothetical protein